MDKHALSALCRLAEDQRGLFSAVQAAQFGINHSQLSRAASHGQLRRARLGVYAVAGTPPSRWEGILAAALAAGPGAIVSHSSAAAIHRLYFAPDGVPELTLPPGYRRRLAGVVAHRRAFLSPRDVMTKYGVQVTSPTRTLLDVAARLEPALVQRILDEGLIDRHWSIAQLLAGLQRAAPNQPGRARIARLVDLRNETPLADSMLELRAFEALQPLAPFKSHFVMNVGKLSFVIDIAWPDRRVGAEIDGRAHRVASRSAFDRERRKLNALAADGWRVAHLTAAMPANEMISAVRALMAGH